MAERKRTKTIKVKLLKFDDIINPKDGTSHNTIWKWYLSESNNGKYMITCTEGVSYPIENGKVEMSFNQIDDKGISMFTTCQPIFTIEQLKTFVGKDDIELHQVVRRHPRVDKNYDDTISYMEANKFNVYKIEEKSNVQFCGI